MTFGLHCSTWSEAPGLTHTGREGLRASVVGAYAWRRRAVFPALFSSASQAAETPFSKWQVSGGLRGRACGPTGSSQPCVVFSCLFLAELDPLMAKRILGAPEGPFQKPATVVGRPLPPEWEAASGLTVKM